MAAGHRIGWGDYKKSVGMLSPLAGSFCNTVLCSYIFICTDLPIVSAGQPKPSSQLVVRGQASIELWQFEQINNKSFLV